MTRFTGDLEEINPSRIINSKKDDELDNFFLVLGLIYNDLKGIVLFERLIIEKYDDPKEETELGAHVGNYNGVKLQIIRLVIGFISETLIFLSMHHSLLGSTHFLLLEKGMDVKRRKDWDEIKNVLVEESKITTNTLLSRIARVRNNVVYHYDHSGDQLRKGFVSHFSLDVPQAKKAYFSLGDDMEHTRFYYSDAAAQKYIMDLLVTKERQYLDEVMPLVNKMNGVFMFLLNNYLEMKRKVKL